MENIQDKIIKEFRERFPISIDYPPITEMEVFTQMEIDSRVKRAKVKNEELELFLLQSCKQVAHDMLSSVTEVIEQCENHGDIGYCGRCSFIISELKKLKPHE